jgi:HD-GYP domain-containing protein (c-di-GMP phosphodiesterase class II)
MRNKIFNFFRPPIYDNIEQTHKAGFLHIALLVVSTACVALGIQNSPGNSPLDIILFILGGICFLCIPVNKLGYFKLVAPFIAGLLLVIITFSLIAGVGLKDAGLSAFPIFIIFSSYLFRKKSVIFTTIISLGSVIFVYYLGKRGFLNPAVVYSDESQLIVLFILFPTAGFLLWVVVDHWERMLKDLQETYDMTLYGWVQALEFRDHETVGHSQRVVEMTVNLAKQLGIPTGKLDDIRRGALLHDIGKIAVPDAILLKRGSLTEDEWKVVKMHPLSARKLLENIPYLKPALEIPYCHHERWDGSGYPQGLSKEAIPLAARIFAVIDVWDAITSDRPYHLAWPEEEAQAYIRDQSGILFDPQVVRVFLAYFGNVDEPASEAPLVGLVEKI